MEKWRDFGPILRWLPNLSCIAAMLLFALSNPVSKAHAGNVPPTLTVFNQVAQCINPTVQIYIDAKASSASDPLPTMTIVNRVAGDSTSYPSNTDPDYYPFGLRTVSVKACDHQTPSLCTQQTITVNVHDTLAPAINGGNNQVVECMQSSPRGTRAAPVYCETTCDSNCNPSSQCKSPNSTSSPSCVACKNACIAQCRSDGLVHTTRPTVSDLCDPNPTLQSSVAPQVYPVGDTQIVLTASDFSSNTATQTLVVRVVDTTSPVFVGTAPSFSVKSHAQNAGTDPLYCSTNGNAGTRVTLPSLLATDVCTPVASMIYSWSGTVANANTQAFAETQNNVVCLGDGLTTIAFHATDAAGNRDTSVVNGNQQPLQPTVSTIRVAAFYPLQVTAQMPTAWAQQASLNAQSTNAQAPLSWSAIGGPQATTLSTSQNYNQLLTMIFKQEGSYCPFYLSATDGNINGAVDQACFGVDATAPVGQLQNIPAITSVPYNQLPIYSMGYRMPLEAILSDRVGQAISGVQSAQVTLSGPSGTQVVYSNTYGASIASAAGLNSCPQTYYVPSCNQVGTLGCGCQNVDSTSQECIGDGRLDFSGLAAGDYSLILTVTDLAGNQSTTSTPFVLTNFYSGLKQPDPNSTQSGIIHVLQALVLDTTTPNAAIAALNQAVLQLQAANLFFLTQPGQAFILASQALSTLDQARIAGANVLYIEQALTRLMQGEVRRIYQAYAQSLGTTRPWNIINPTTNAAKQSGVAVRGAYQSRQFLVDRGGVFRDFTIDPAKILTASQSSIALADQYFAQGDYTNTMAASQNAYDTLALIFNDQTLANLYGGLGYTPTSVSLDSNSPNTLSDATYFEITQPNRFGDEAAIVVAKQISQFVQLVQNSNQALQSVIPQSAISRLQVANNALQSFSTAVQQVKNRNWGGFNNQQIVQNVYLNAITALSALSSISQNSLYTHYWQYGVGLSLANTLNFSVYEGPTALTCILWGQNSDSSGRDGFAGCGNVAYPGAPFIYDMQGNLSNTMDYDAQISECRYNRMMYALADGRLNTLNQQGALDLFGASACLIIELYNRYYINFNHSGVYISGHYIASDKPIDPNAYGCGPALNGNAVSMPAECGGCNVQGGQVKCLPNSGCDTTCDGVDDDCNGLVDDNYQPTACGCGSLPASVCPCAATSTCVSGQVLPCVPGVPSTNQDVLCNGLDNDCDGVLADDFLATTCGVGGCMSQAACNVNASTFNETYLACVPGQPTAEICDHIDNNCNVLVDEGLDADQDGYGCTPGSVGCAQCVPGSAGCTGASLCAMDTTQQGAWTGTWDCDDSDPSTHPNAPEICDYKDNNCNGQIDEGVRNACNTCDPTCLTSTLGPSGLPFAPTPSSASNVSVDPNTGAITLATSDINQQFAWIANDLGGTISKLDTTTGREVARYCQAIKTGVTNFATGRDPSGATYDTRAEPTVCAGCGGCNNGSRTAVDFDGSMIIANRAYSGSGYVGTVTKVSGTLSSCVDVNGDGIIQTSRDLDGDGVINPNQNLPAATREYWGELDECILYTRKPVMWEGTTQPLCNNPNWINGFAAANRASVCTTQGYPPSPSVCQYQASCAGAGRSACSSITSQATCQASTDCQWTATCSGPTSYLCPYFSTQAVCNASQPFCQWAAYCAPTPCTTWSQSQCGNHQGCSYQSICYNVADGPFPNFGIINPMPRAMALDANGDAWVGLFNRQGFLQIDNDTGLVKRWVYTGTHPYGSTLDKNGILWHGDSCCGTNNVIAGLNTTPLTITYTNPNTKAVSKQWAPYGLQQPASSVSGLYGIATDKAGMVYIGGYPQTVYAGYKYDPYHDTFTPIAASKNSLGVLNPGAGVGRGVAVDSSGLIWIAQQGAVYGTTNGRITGFNPTTLAPAVDVYLGSQGQSPIGVGVGYGGKIWSSNQLSYNVACIDPNTQSAAFFPVGGPPYCYSDFTGAVLRNITAPSGSYADIVSACYGTAPSSWGRLTWSGQTPVGTQNNGQKSAVTQMQFRVRGTYNLVTRDAHGNAVDPLVASNWTYWYPNDASNPNNAGNSNVQYYWNIVAANNAPSTGPCAGVQQQSYNGSTNTYAITGCADLSGVPLTYNFGNNAGVQPMAYLEVQAFLLADPDGTVEPTLNSVNVVRTCPQP